MAYSATLIASTTPRPTANWNSDQAQHEHTTPPRAIRQVTVTLLCRTLPERPPSQLPFGSRQLTDARGVVALAKNDHLASWHVSMRRCGDAAAGQLRQPSVTHVGSIFPTTKRGLDSVCLVLRM